MSQTSSEPAMGQHICDDVNLDGIVIIKGLLRPPWTLFVFRILGSIKMILVSS